ncbi:hypothetical protein [Microbacterium sp. NPDC056234]|uniref:hypothetical protein n=1 Tax=Microbacterium sp. NPDC056234 TaxID=3345757 RepID=UPI0035DF57E4
MYEHPSLTITAMLHEQEMLNRAVERRRAILERLETQSVPRRGWFVRAKAALGVGPRRTVAAERPSAGTTERAASAAAERPTACVPSVAASDRSARRILAECAPADAGVLMAPAR